MARGLFRRLSLRWDSGVSLCASPFREESRFPTTLWFSDLSPAGSHGQTFVGLSFLAGVPGPQGGGARVCARAMSLQLRALGCLYLHVALTPCP